MPALWDPVRFKVWLTDNRLNIPPVGAATPFSPHRAISEGSAALSK